jgi:hypothetical protein
MSRKPAVTVYLGSSGNARKIFKDQAELMGKNIAESGKLLVYGGMNAGPMGILANSALEKSGEVLGIIPRNVLDIARFHKNLSKHIIVDDLWERKRLLFNNGDAIIIMPGGFGTLDEALEAIWWAALGLHDKPVIFVNTDNYWSHAIRHLRKLPECGKGVFQEVASAAEVMKIIGGRPAFKAREEQGYLPHLENEIVKKTVTPIIISEVSLMETYRLISALGLKQVGAHSRPIGLLNRNGTYDSLLEWIKVAAKERFITRKCPRLMKRARTEKGLMAALEKRGERIIIDLVNEKWGGALDEDSQKR